MSHVDDGLLHAYLDGAFEAGSAERREIEAHLDVCADCRVRLDDAQQTKRVAQQALDATAPAGAEPPAWDEIVAEHTRRRGAVAPVAPVRRRPRIPLAWAASLFIAVGAGWMARSLTVSQPASLSESLEQPALAADRAADEEGQAARDAVAAPAPAVEALENASREQELLRAVPGERRAAAPAAEATPPPPETAPTRQARARATAKAADPLTSSFRADTTALGRADRIALDELVVRGHAATAGAEVFGDLDDASARLRLTTLDTLAANAGAWQLADLDSLAALDPPPARVDGVEPIRLEHATVGGWSLVRAFYVLDGDSTLVVLQGRAAAEDRLADANLADARTGQRAAEARNEVAEQSVDLSRTVEADGMREVRGWSVLIRGTPDAVRALAARLR